MLVECINLSIDCYFVIFAGYYSNILSNYVSEQIIFFRREGPSTTNICQVTEILDVLL